MNLRRFLADLHVRLSASSERRPSSLNEYLGEIWSAIKLSHAQLVFRFRSEEDRRNQRLQFLTGECFAVSAALDALLFCAGPSSALLVCDLAVAWAPVTFHVLCGLTFVTGEFAPAVNQSLYDGGIFGSSPHKGDSCNHNNLSSLCFRSRRTTRLLDVSSSPGEVSGQLDSCECALSGIFCVGLCAPHFLVGRYLGGRLNTFHQVGELSQITEVKASCLRSLEVATVL